MKSMVAAACFAASVALGLGLDLADAQARTNRALVIGVSDYDNLPRNEWLEGARHDAELVRDFLRANRAVPFEPSNVTVLASGIEGAARPTRAGIMDAFAALARDAAPGDFVYIHYSGHGSQQPERVAGQEQDGLDEILLPADVTPSPDGKVGMGNVILDDEIGAALDAIRDRGAFVWIVIDACHSGTATRAVGTREKERKISPEATGISAETLAAARRGATRGGAERESAFTVEDGVEMGGRGGLVAFFGAQTVETAPELPLPDKATDARMYGLFTYTLMTQLAGNPAVTYRQLSQGILQHYSAMNRTKPTPLFEGDLDAPVFGADPGGEVLQWKLTVNEAGISLPAGRLHRIVPGTKLAVLASPLADMSEAIGYLDVRSATNLSSRLLPADYGGRRALPVTEIPDGAYARVAELEVSFELVVARPPPAPGLEAQVAAANAALDAVAADTKAPIKLRVVDAGSDADIRLAVIAPSAVAGAEPDASAQPVLWLLPPSGEITLAPGRRPPSVALDADTQRQLASGLVLISRATNLSRLAGASDFRASDIAVSFLVERAGAEGDFEPVEAGSVPILHPGDSIYVKASNTSRRPVDLNVLYVGSDYQIYSATEPIRLHEREELPQTGLFTVSEGTFGNERLIAVLTEALPQTPTLDLGYLAQPGVRQATRSSAAPEGFAGLLSDIATAPSTRDVKRFQDKRGTKGAVLVYPVETAPAPP